MGTKITRSDVARMAGVSPAVVSYVTNGGPRPVSSAARARVEAAIDALGYRPDALANAFRDGKTKSIGLLMPSPMNPFYAELAHLAEKELVRRGYVLSIGISEFNASQDASHFHSVDDRRMSGLLIASAASLPPAYNPADWATPHVILDRVEDVAADAASVFADSYHDIRRAVDHLQYHGHTAIACIAGPSTSANDALRVAAWRDQQLAAGIIVDDYMVARGEVSEEGGSMAVRALLEEESYRHSRHNDRPTAIVVTSDVQAFGVLRVCHELGIRVPEDLAIVSYDGVRAGLFSLPRLTTMRPPMREIVRTAISRLLDSDDDTAEPLMHQALRGNLLIGESCGCEQSIKWSGGMS